MEKDIPCSYYSKESWIRYMNFRRTVFRTRNTTKNKEWHYIMVKRSIIRT